MKHLINKVCYFLMMCAYVFKHVYLTMKRILRVAKIFLLTNQTRTINGVTYHFDENGRAKQL